MTKERALQKSKQYREWGQKNLDKAKEIYSKYCEEMKDFDWTQPILRGHHSQRRHEKIYERRNSIHEKVNELEAKGKRMLEKAENLERFANTHKGDAEKKREEKRKELDEILSVGDTIYTMYGAKEILKVNKKTYTIQVSAGTFTYPKHFVSEYKKNNL
jgi:hypothetical protein